MNDRKKTYHRRFLTGRICYRDERCIEVVQVHFASCLEFVEKIEEMEREGSTGTSPSCWKPADMKKLATTGGGFHFVIVTETVCDSDHVDTRDVEECE